MHEVRGQCLTADAEYRELNTSNEGKEEGFPVTFQGSPINAKADEHLV